MANVPIYKSQGGDTLTVDSDGTLVLNGSTTLGSAAGMTISGTFTIGATGELDIVAGGKITDDGTQASAIADVSVTGTYATDDTPIETAINSILAALRGVGIVASS